MNKHDSIVCFNIFLQREIARSPLAGLKGFSQKGCVINSNSQMDRQKDKHMDKWME